MTITYTFWHKNMRKMLANPEELIGMLIQPILWVVLFGVGMKSLIDAGAMGGDNEVSYIAFMASGIVALSALGGAIAGGATWLNERLQGTVNEYLAAPISRTSILTGNAMSIVTKGMIQAILIFIVSLFMGAQITTNLFNIFLALVLVFGFTMGFAGIALAFASVADNPAGYHMMIMILNLPLLFASNALYPIEVLPDWMKIIAYLNPVTYLNSGLRELLYINDGVNASSEVISSLLPFIAIALFAILGILWARTAFKRSLAD
jgi:ABC-2 type transport system permease protein